MKLQTKHVVCVFLVYFSIGTLKFPKDATSIDEGIFKTHFGYNYNNQEECVNHIEATKPNVILIKKENYMFAIDYTYNTITSPFWATYLECWEGFITMKSISRKE